MWPYVTSDAALTDVLRLSRAMSYKNALAGLPLGGGKSVIIGDPRVHKTPQLLAAFAGCVERLAGGYWTAEDVGIGVADVEILAAHTRYVFGRAEGTGDPSAFTAAGCFQGMRACLAHVYGDDAFAGRTVAVQGAGNVGRELCRMLSDAGARLVVADANAAAAEWVRVELGATVVDPGDVHRVPCDIYAPCALGGTLNQHTIPQLQARIVCGVANNQLARAEHGEQLRTRGIVFAPDYVVNAGGMHNASGDILGPYERADVMRRIEAVRAVTAEILERASSERRPTNEIADELARERMQRRTV